MKSIELILLIFAYTILILTIFISFLCYRKNFEKWETIAFSTSLLVLIVSLTAPPLLGDTTLIEKTNIFTLLSMVLLSLTTPLNVLSERKHRIPNYFKNVLYGISLILFLLTIINYFLDDIIYLEYVIIFFLASSVILSMILIRVTKPQKSIAHREKIERIFAILFLIVVPVSLFANYTMEENGYDLKVGFTLPLVFILLSVNKLLDDLKRLSLLNTETVTIEQHFANYGLTQREKEIVALLLKGKTYKLIAEELFISLPTVKTHASNVYKKCSVNSRHELNALLKS